MPYIIQKVDFPLKKVLLIPVDGIICAPFMATLSIYCISLAFIYGFHILQTNLQEVSFCSVKGRLSKGKKICLES